MQLNSETFCLEQNFMITLVVCDSYSRYNQVQATFNSWPTVTEMIENTHKFLIFFARAARVKLIICNYCSAKRSASFGGMLTLIWALSVQIWNQFTTSVHSLSSPGGSCFIKRKYAEFRKFEISVMSKLWNSVNSSGANVLRLYNLRNATFLLW